MKILSRHFLGDNAYISYPHCNCFAEGGQELIYARGNGTKATLYRMNLETRDAMPIADMGPAMTKETAIWYELAMHGTRIVALFDNKGWFLDLNGPKEWTLVYEPQPGHILQGLPSVTADGKKLLCGEYRPGSSAAIEIDLDSGRSTDLFTHEWHANHFHYCPFDESWIGYSHDGPTEVTPDRCWVWHAQLAPEGKKAFDQKSDDPDKYLYVGHERMSLHDTSGYVIAYAVSPAGKRGLWEYFVDERPARLLWESDVAWHCSMDETGRFAALDTTGPWDANGLSDEAKAKAVAEHIKADEQRLPNRSEVVLLDLETRTDLFLGSVIRTRHPFHPHPAVSPDARWVAYTDSGSQGTPGFWLLGIDTEA